MEEQGYSDDDLMEPEYYPQQPQQVPQRPVIQGYNPDQVNIIKSVEVIQSLLTEVAMPPFKVTRLQNAIVYLLVLGEMPEMLSEYIEIPKPQPQPVPQQQQAPAQRPQQAPVQRPQQTVPEIPDEPAIPDMDIEPEFPTNETNLDAISNKMKEIDKGVMEDNPQEKPKSAIGNILSKITGGKKDKPEQSVKEQHRPESIG